MSLWSLIVALEDDDYPAHPQKTVTVTWQSQRRRSGEVVSGVGWIEEVYVELIGKFRVVPDCGFLIHELIR